MAWAKSASSLLWVGSGALALGGGQCVDQLVVLIDAQHPVGRQALDGEGPGDADLGIVGIGLVVEIFELGLGGDGGIDLLLAGDAAFPPVAVHLLCLLRPGLVGLARDFPFLPRLAEEGIEALADRLQHLLPFLPDDVDLGIVGDGLEGDVGHALIDEAQADIAMGGLVRRHRAGDLGFLLLAFGQSARR